MTTRPAIVCPVEPLKNRTVEANAPSSANTRVNPPMNKTIGRIRRDRGWSASPAIPPSTAEAPVTNDR
jgi:hypothetical protein